MFLEVKAVKRAAISENSVKMIFHFTFAILVLVIVTGLVLHYFQGRINSEDLETQVYANIVEKCLSKVVNDRVYVGVIDPARKNSFQECFYVSASEPYKDIMAVNASLLIDDKNIWSVYYNPEKYEFWRASITKKGQFKRYILEKNVIYEAGPKRYNARLLIDVIYP